MSRDVNERGPRVFAGQALTQRLGVVADSFQQGVALPYGGEAIGYASGSRAMCLKTSCRRWHGDTTDITEQR